MHWRSAISQFGVQFRNKFRHKLHSKEQIKYEEYFIVHYLWVI